LWAEWAAFIALHRPSKEDIPICVQPLQA